MKKYLRFFGGFIETQEKWLNKMANTGYRLVKTRKLLYVFETCQPGAYQYAIDFIAHYDAKTAKEYRTFLEDVGYKVFPKNIQLNYSIGKIKWRLYGGGFGTLATKNSTYSKELLIVEKESDNKKFQLHSTYADKLAYYQPLRNAWLMPTTLFLISSIYDFLSTHHLTKDVIIFGLLSIICALPTLLYQRKIMHYKASSTLSEQ